MVRRLEQFGHSRAPAITSEMLMRTLFVDAAGRGGWGHLKNREEIEAARQREVEETYGESGANRDVPTGEKVPDEVSCQFRVKGRLSALLVAWQFSGVFETPACH